MQDVPSRFVDIVQQLKEGKQPRRASVRSVLKWFGAARRGATVVAQIEEALQATGLAAEPPFAEAGIDEPLRFSLKLPLDASARSGAAPATAGGSEALSASADASDGGSQTTTNGSGSWAEASSPDSLEGEADEDEPPGRVDDQAVSSQPNDWNVARLRDKLDRGQLDLQPQYQREYVWRLRPELPSRLIESLLLEIPIPPIYFGKVAGGRLEVIDGQQRLTTMIDFVSNRFRLQRLQRLGSTNNRLFKELTEEQQAKIMDAPIRSVVIDAGRGQCR